MTFKLQKISGLGDAQLALAGKIQMQDTMPFEGKLSAQQFNLRDLGDFPSSQLAGAFDVNGDLKPNFKLNLQGELQQSRWANASAQGQVDVTYEMPDKIEARQFDVTIGENRFQAKGALGKPQDRLNLNISAPNLAQLQFGFAGSLNATGDLSGALVLAGANCNCKPINWCSLITVFNHFASTGSGKRVTMAR